MSSSNNGSASTGTKKKTANKGETPVAAASSEKGAGKKRNEKQDAAIADSTTSTTSSYKALLTLPAIQDRIMELVDRVPSQQDTAALVPSNTETLEAWCRTVRKLIREFNLVLNFCHPATYQWAPDRSGHNEQNVGALRSEINYSSSAVDMLITSVNQVLTPSYDKLLEQSVKTTVENVKTVKYTYVQVVDEELHQLHKEQLCEEAMDKREFLVVVLERMHQAIQDYIKADNSSSNADRLTMAY